MKSYRGSNVGTMHIARSGNSFRDELPVPGDYRTGCPEGGGIVPEVSWTSDTRVGGISGLVDLFRTTFVFGINSSRQFYGIGQFIRQCHCTGAVRCSVCYRGVVKVWVSYLYSVIRSKQL